MKKKKSLSLIASAIIGVLYSIYLVSYFGGAMFGSESGAEALGGAIATALVTPHMLCVSIAAIFNLVACFTYKRAFALTCAILYTAAAILFLMYAFFVVPCIVLSFVGFARLKSINEYNQSLASPGTSAN